MCVTDLAFYWRTQNFLQNCVQFVLFLILLFSTVIIHRLRIGRANWVKIADDIRGCYQMYFTRLTGLWNHKHSLIELTVGDKKKCNIEIISIVYIILFLAILFSFCGPLLWNNAKIFTPYKHKNHTKTNNCTDCVYTEYWGKYLPSFSFLFLWKQSNLNNKINHIMTKLQKNIIKVLLIRIILISTIISADIRLFFLFVHDEQNEVLSINNKKL